MKAVLNRFMSRLGYVPGPSKVSAHFGSLKIDIDSTSVDTSMKALDLMSAAAGRAEEALARTCAAAALTSKALLQVEMLTPTTEQFATAELAADETQPLILAELRKQTTLLEVLAKQGEENRRDIEAAGACALSIKTGSGSVDHSAQQAWRDVIGFPGLPG